MNFGKFFKNEEKGGKPAFLKECEAFAKGMDAQIKNAKGVKRSLIVIATEKDADGEATSNVALLGQGGVLIESLATFLDQEGVQEIVRPAMSRNALHHLARIFAKDCKDCDKRDECEHCDHKTDNNDNSNK